MEKLSYISQDLFSAFTALKDGNVKVPDALEVYKKLTIEDQIQIWKDEIKQYEAEKEPSVEELIQLGKDMHPYYQNQMRLEELIVRLKSYEVKEIEPILIKK
jgi:hypothetical protein